MPGLALSNPATSPFLFDHTLLADLDPVPTVRAHEIALLAFGGIHPPAPARVTRICDDPLFLLHAPLPRPNYATPQVAPVPCTAFRINSTLGSPCGGNSTATTSTRQGTLSRRSRR